MPQALQGGPHPIGAEQSQLPREWRPEHKRAEEWKGPEAIPHRQWEDSDFHYIECPTCHLQLSYTSPAGSEVDSSAAAAGAAAGARREEADDGFRGAGVAPISHFGSVPAPPAPAHDSSSSLASGASASAPISNFGSVRAPAADSGWSSSSLGTSSGAGWGTSSSLGSAGLASGSVPISGSSYAGSSGSMLGAGTASSLSADIRAGEISRAAGDISRAADDISRAAVDLSRAGVSDARGPAPAV